jgi:hypothetical protein
MGDGSKKSPRRMSWYAGRNLRRLIVPLSCFIERSFQNGTRQTADWLGTVFIYADYPSPLRRFARNCMAYFSPRRNFAPLMGAPSGSVAWDLRCLVRARLIAVRAAELSASLPKNRAEIASFGLKPEAWQNGEQSPGSAKGSQSLRTTLEPTG